MSSRVDREARKVLALVLSTTAVLLAAPLAAISGVNAEATDPAGAASAAGTAEPRVLERSDGRAEAQGRTYQLRCWQYGRLVFEENGVRFDLKDEGHRQRLRGTDRQGLAVILTDTSNATCLIRAERNDRADPGRRR